MKDFKGLNTQRQLPVDLEAVDSRNRIIPFTLISKNNECERFDWCQDEVYIEKLDPMGADYSRLNTFFKDHNRTVDSAIGKVENIRLENGELKASVRFSKDDIADKVFQKYLEGILTDCSIGYKILDTKQESKNGQSIVTVTKFEIFELSAVGIGADKDAKAFRSEQNILEIGAKKEMEKKELENPKEGIEASADIPKLDNEKLRTDEILNLVEAGQLDLSKARSFINEKTNIDEIRKFILNEKIRASSVVVGGVPEADTMKRKIEDSILQRSGLKVDVSNNEFRGASLSDMLRTYLNLDSRSPYEIAQRAMSSSDFPLLLAGVGERVLKTAFEEANTTYNIWTKKTELTNFKLQQRIGFVNPNGRLSKINEKGELESLEFGENGNNWKLESYGNKILFTRQMIINDDLGAFSNTILEFGKMAKRTANGLVYDLLQSKNAFTNYKLADSKAIFDTAHGNVGNIMPLNSENLSKARASMRRQKAGAISLNIIPKYLIVSPENEETARKLLMSDSDLSSNNSGVTNIHKNSFELIVDSELEGNDWYLASSENTILVGYLAGTNGLPLIKENQKSASGIEFECLFDFGLTVEDYRGLFKGKGA